MDYSDKLARAVEHGHLCVGLDPVLEKLPEHLRNNPRGLHEFLRAIVHATAPYAAAFKPNLAFYEAMGLEGDEALRNVVSEIRAAAPHAIVIGDGKRGDIGSTAVQYAHALFTELGVDAATVNPWFGTDGIEPFTRDPGRGVFLLAATSNPSAVEVQNADGLDLPVTIARLSNERWNANKNVGLVVGATRVADMQRVREAGSDLPWLIPGIGAQGGDLVEALRYGMRGAGGELVPSLINASRSIIYASPGSDFAEAAGAEAKRLHDSIIDAKNRIGD